MQLIRCPWCGPREEIEYRFGGQAGLAYPDDPSALDDTDWAALLFLRDNTAGPARERWQHAAGCRQWFTATRDTTTYVMTDVRPALGRARNDPPDDAPAHEPTPAPRPA